MIALAVDIGGICYYEVPIEIEALTTARCLEFFKRPMDYWHGNRRNAVWLLDDNTILHRRTSINLWIEQTIYSISFNPFILPISPCDYGNPHILKRATGGQLYLTIEKL